MPATLISRRSIARSLVALSAGLGLSARVVAGESSATDDGLTHSSATIHQELLFKASRPRVFEALTHSDQFDAITRLSDAVALVTAANAKPTSISRDIGGSFTLFGGYVTGQNVEMSPDERLVQVWRAGSWQPGDYSIVKFVLIANGAETKMVFDHRGFPDAEGSHLAAGWHSHYWEPLSKFLASNQR
jgi:activator of HSP90 ATPase